MTFTWLWKNNKQCEWYVKGSFVKLEGKKRFKWLNVDCIDVYKGLIDLFRAGWHLTESPSWQRGCFTLKNVLSTLILDVLLSPLYCISHTLAGGEGTISVFLLSLNTTCKQQMRTVRQKLWQVACHQSCLHMSCCDESAARRTDLIILPCLIAGMQICCLPSSLRSLSPIEPQMCLTSSCYGLKTQGTRGNLAQCRLSMTYAHWRWRWAPT